MDEMAFLKLNDRLKLDSRSGNASISIIQNKMGQFSITKQKNFDFTKKWSFCTYGQCPRGLARPVSWPKNINLVAYI